MLDEPIDKVREAVESRFWASTNNGRRAHAFCIEDSWHGAAKFIDELDDLMIDGWRPVNWLMEPRKDHNLEPSQGWKRVPVLRCKVLCER